MLHPTLQPANVRTWALTIWRARAVQAQLAVSFDFVTIRSVEDDAFPYREGIIAFHDEFARRRSA